jgi:large-conductance mechanosensitive channel
VGNKKVNSVDIALNFASIVNFTGLILLLRTVIKNRNFLRGFSTSGCFLTFVAICGFQIAYFMDNMISFLLGLSAAVFWFVAFAYSLRQMMHASAVKKKEDAAKTEKQQSQMVC